MFPARRRATSAEEGFSLIELLVVILIIGILAAIAIPSFISQKQKANDAAAKVQARTAQTAAESYATDHNGKYEGLSVEELRKVEPTLNDTSAAELTLAKAAEGGGYEVVSKSISTGNTFKIERNAASEVKRTCKRAGSGGCSSTETW